MGQPIEVTVEVPDPAAPAPVATDTGVAAGAALVTAGQAEDAAEEAAEVAEAAAGAAELAVEVAFNASDELAALRFRVDELEARMNESGTEEEPAEPEREAPAPPKKETEAAPATEAETEKPEPKSGGGVTFAKWWDR